MVFPLTAPKKTDEFGFGYAAAYSRPVACFLNNEASTQSFKADTPSTAEQLLASFSSET